MRRIYFLAFMIIFLIVTISNAQTIEDKDLCVAGNGQENAQACTRYGRILFQDESNPANVDLSMDYFVRSCKLGLLTYCGFAGNLMYYGTKVVKDQVTAFSLLATACDNGKFDYHACYLSGLLALNGEAVEKNTETGLYLLDKGCRNGDEFACDKLVRTYNFGDEGIAEQNLALTVDYAHNGCVYNAGYSCYIAGYYLMTGAPGINKNVDEAQKHLERGCELNSAESCYNLSTLLTANHEFAEVSEAIKNNYQKACELNLYEGCAGTGYVLAKQQNFSEAVVWYTKACDADNMGGCKGLAEIYSAAQNTETSRKFSQKACDLGDQESCDYVKEVDKYLAEIIAYEKYLAQQEEKATQITNELKEGDYSRAMDIAVNELASRDQAARVIMATENAGKISSIPQVYFYNLMNWFVTDYQQAGAIVNRELRAINESNRASQNQIRVTPTPRLNSSSYLSEAADKFYKDSYQRNLNRYIQGGNPSDVRVGLFLKR